MYIKALKNIRIKGQHVALHETAETDPQTARDLIGGGFAEAAEKPAPPKKAKAKKETKTKTAQTSEE